MSYFENFITYFIIRIFQAKITILRTLFKKKYKLKNFKIFFIKHFLRIYIKCYIFIKKFQEMYLKMYIFHKKLDTTFNFKAIK